MILLTNQSFSDRALILKPTQLPAIHLLCRWVHPILHHLVKILFYRQPWYLREMALHVQLGYFLLVVLLALDTDVVEEFSKIWESFWSNHIIMKYLLWKIFFFHLMKSQLSYFPVLISPSLSAVCYSCILVRIFSLETFFDRCFFLIRRLYSFNKIDNNVMLNSSILITKLFSIYCSCLRP